MPAGIESPIARPSAALRPGDWNTIELVLDANILRTFVNDNAGVGDTVAEQESDATVHLRSMPAEPAKCDSKISRTRIFNRGSRFRNRSRRGSACRR